MEHIPVLSYDDLLKLENKGILLRLNNHSRDNIGDPYIVHHTLRDLFFDEDEALCLIVERHGKQQTLIQGEDFTDIFDGRYATHFAKDYYDRRERERARSGIPSTLVR